MLLIDIVCVCLCSSTFHTYTVLEAFSLFCKHIYLIQVTIVILILCLQNIISCPWQLLNYYKMFDLPCFKGFQFLLCGCVIIEPAGVFLYM